ncbi:MAG: S4 domain-containing protein, partial [Planctomycetota bacterium]
MVRHPKKVPPDLSMPVQTMERVVEREFDGLRLDAYLRKRLPWRSREVYQSMIKSGRVLVNDRVKKPSSPVHWKDVVWVDFGEATDMEQDPSAIPLDRLYEDDDLLVLNKQPGVIVHPTGRSRFNTIMNALHLHYRDMENPENDIVPKLVHRLDRHTSGV